MRRKPVKVTRLTCSALELPKLAGARRALYNPKATAHWCSWLTRCPLKAEITGSSPVCAANLLKHMEKLLRDESQTHQPDVACPFSIDHSFNSTIVISHCSRGSVSAR